MMEYEDLNDWEKVALLARFLLRDDVLFSEEENRTLKDIVQSQVELGMND